MDQNKSSQIFQYVKENLSALNLKTLIFSIILIALLSILLNTRRRKLKLPPGPTGLPIVGYFPFLGKEPCKVLNELGKKYGNIFSLYLGRKRVVILNDWTAVTEAFSKNEIANRPPNLFDALPKGFGIGGLNGTEWAQQRRFIMKAMKDIGFGRTYWEQLVQEEVDDVAHRIVKHGTSPMDVCEMFSSTFANNVMTLIFGRRLPMDHPDVKFISKSVDLVMNAFPTLGILNYMPVIGTILEKLGLKIKHVTLKQLEGFSNFVEKKINEMLGKTEGDAFITEYFNEIQQNKVKNLKNTFTEYSLQGNTQSLLLGGSETTRSASLWFFIAMAENQDIQKKVQEELDSVLGKDGRITWSERNKVPYTYATIMESLRWRTLVPVNTLRMAMQDVEVCGYDIPKGTIVVANFWALHNDTRYWHDPEKMIPERFLSDGGKQINFKKDSHVPFSYGKRNCPGELIALMELLSYFTFLMQRFTVLPTEGDRVNYVEQLGLTFQPIKFTLRFIPRE